jgi:hypothetical protein
MGPLVSQGTELALEMVRRDRERAGIERAINPLAPSSPTMTPLNPDLVSLIGAGVDGLSTYKFLKEGAGAEGNPTLVKMFNHHPLKTGLGAAAGGLINLLAARAVERFGGPLGKKIAPIMNANNGIDQLLVGTANFDLLNPPFPGQVIRDNDTRSSFAKANDWKAEGVRKMRR